MIEPVKNDDNISSSSEFTKVEEAKETNFNRDQFSISYYALSGYSTPQTMRAQGYIKSQLPASCVSLDTAVPVEV